jgi:hypothetical protein
MNILRQLILRTIKPTLSSYQSVPLKPIHTFRIQQQQQQQQQQRAFSISPSTHWKSIGTPKKNRKTRCKLKTHQGASKRFFVTGRGQFKRVECYQTQPRSSHWTKSRETDRPSPPIGPSGNPTSDDRTHSESETEAQADGDRQTIPDQSVAQAAPLCRQTRRVQETRSIRNRLVA